jgi:hypothetical protein
VYFSILFHTKGTKMAQSILELLLKAGLKTTYCVFLLLSKKVYKFQLCLKTGASLFPFSSLTFLIGFSRFSTQDEFEIVLAAKQPSLKLNAQFEQLLYSCLLTIFNNFEIFRY